MGSWDPSPWLTKSPLLLLMRDGGQPAAQLCTPAPQTENTAGDWPECGWHSIQVEPPRWRRGAAHAQ